MNESPPSFGDPTPNWRQSAMHRRERGTGDEGVTLVELMVTILILTGVFLALTYASINGVASTHKAASQVGADQVVNATIEDLRTQTWSAVAPSGTSTTLTSSTQVVSGVTYTITGTISWVDDACNGTGTTPKDYLKFDITASWKTRNVTRTENVIAYRNPTLVEMTPTRVTSTC
jgi:Tfp pilus assembly protein FimT